MSLLRVNKSDRVTTTPAFCFTPTHTVEYPRSAIERLKSKPLVELQASSISLNEFRGIIKSGIKNRKLNAETAKFYLYLVLKEVKETLDRDWTSYGIPIGSANAEICPWDLLNISFVEGLTKDDKTEAATSHDDQWMVLYILSIYRLSNTDTHLRRTVIAKIVNQMQMVSKPFILSAMEASSAYFSWQHDINYLKMIAAVDMFFTRFPLNSWAHIKIGTIGTRFKACGALLALDHMRTMLGLSYEGVKAWIFTEAVADNIDQMLKDEEEVGEEFSYFPYQVDLGLVAACCTAYSVRANPATFAFAHSICALLGSARSINAKFPTQPFYLFGTKLNAQVMAYAFSKKLENPNNGEDVKAQGTASGMPLGTDAKAWLIYMNKMNVSSFNIPEDMQAFITGAKNKMGVVRDGTIGKYAAGEHL